MKTALKYFKETCETIEKEYELEYGTATIEMHKDSIQPGQKVLIVDDLIATGGTTLAMIELIEQLGGNPTPAVGFAAGLERLLMVMEQSGVEIPAPAPVTVH
mgnify:CR=1 FL=1